MRGGCKKPPLFFGAGTIIYKIDDNFLTLQDKAETLLYQLSKHLKDFPKDFPNDLDNPKTYEEQEAYGKWAKRFFHLCGELHGVGDTISGNSKKVYENYLDGQRTSDPMELPDPGKPSNYL